MIGIKFFVCIEKARRFGELFVLSFSFLFYLIEQKSMPNCAEFLSFGVNGLGNILGVNS